MTDATELDEAAVRALATKQAAAYARMLEIGQGVGGLGVQHPDMFEDMLAWDDATENDHADTVLAALDEITRLRAALDEAEAEANALAASHNRLGARFNAARAALATIRTLARSWSGRHDLLMTGDSAAHDIEAALATPTTTERSEG